MGAEAKKLFKEAEVKRFIRYIHKNRQLLPLIITNIKVMTISRQSHDNLQTMLNDIVKRGLLTARGVVGFWRANSKVVIIAIIIIIVIIIIAFVFFIVIIIVLMLQANSKVVKIIIIVVLAIVFEIIIIIVGFLRTKSKF